jgi:hypothetical protein
VGGSEHEKGTGSDLFFRYFFYRGFGLPSPRNAQKRDKKESRKNQFWIFGRIFVKTFRHDLFCKTFFVVFFELPSLGITRKRDKTKKVEENLTSNFLSIFLGKAFDMDFLQKYFMMFLNSPYRETPKNVLKKKSQEKKCRMVGGWV